MDDNKRQVFEAIYSQRDLAGFRSTAVHLKTGEKTPIWTYHNRITQALWEGFNTGINWQLGQEAAKVDNTLQEREAIIFALTYPSKADESIEEQADHILHVLKRTRAQPAPAAGDVPDFSSDEWIIVRREAKKHDLTVGQLMRQAFKIYQCSTPEAKAALAAIEAQQPKGRGEDYPHQNTVDRYEVKVGKYGSYIWDKERSLAQELSWVVSKLNRCDWRTAQLRWYVEKYGEVSPTQPPAQQPQQDVVERAILQKNAMKEALCEFAVANGAKFDEVTLVEKDASTPDTITYEYSIQKRPPIALPTPSFSEDEAVEIMYKSAAALGGKYRDQFRVAYRALIAAGVIRGV